MLRETIKSVDARREQNLHTDHPELAEAINYKGPNT